MIMKVLEDGEWHELWELKDATGLTSNEVKGFIRGEKIERKCENEAVSAYSTRRNRVRYYRKIEKV